MKSQRPESWQQLFDEISELFTEVNKSSQSAVVIKEIVMNLKNNQSIYEDDPNKFFEFIKENDYMKDLAVWFPYLVGDRINIINIKLFDCNGIEFVENPINVNVKDIFVRFYPNIEKMKIFTKSSTLESKLKV